MPHSENMIMQSNYPREPFFYGFVNLSWILV
jgi:hypothetical protein